MRVKDQGIKGIKETTGAFDGVWSK